MKFLVDMPLSPQLAEWLRQQGHNAIHAVEVGLERASEIVILKRARREQRVIITADLDYPRLLAISRSTGPGLILFRNGDYSDAESLERLQHVLEVIPHEELPSSVIVIEKQRIRRRRLPIE